MILLFHLQDMPYLFLGGIIISEEAVKRFLQFAILIATSVVAANAAITVTLDATSPVDLGGGLYKWTWEATLNADSRVQNTSSGSDDSERDGFFTIYDITGITAAAVLTQPVDWVGTAQLIGTNPQTPVAQNPTDSNGVHNITWRYNGATPIIGPGSLGFFSVESTVNYSTQGFYTYRDLLNGGPNNGQPQAGSSTTSVPGGPGQVPEPATMGLMGGALAGLAIVVRCRKQA